jgi:hypothetical protein
MNDVLQACWPGTTTACPAWASRRTGWRCAPAAGTPSSKYGTRRHVVISVTQAHSHSHKHPHTYTQVREHKRAKIEHTQALRQTLPFPKQSARSTERRTNFLFLHIWIYICMIESVRFTKQDSCASH